MQTAIHYDDYAQEIKYLKLVLPEMARHKIPTTPENYAVWYEYSSGKNPLLVKEIDSLKDAQRPFTQNVNDMLYETFIAKRPQLPIHQLNSSVKNIIDSLLARMHKEGQGLNEYSQSLVSLSDQVTRIGQLSDLEELIGQLVSEAHQRSLENDAFRAQIQQMSKQVEVLDQRLKRVARDADTDSLTGIYNRRAFNKKLSESLGKAKNALSLVMLDIDHFKKLNDQHGHLTGDKVLKFVASVIGKNIRGQDYLARFGGEEFVIILPETSLESALCVANNIRNYLANQILFDSSNDTQLGRLTLSMGVATREEKDTAETLIERADKCLYLAKDQGRNKAICQRQLIIEQISS